MPEDPGKELERLRAVRHALLQLHKTLLEAERVRYERLEGRIEGSGRLLHLLLHDPWFAWLRPLSALVVQIDEVLDAKAGEPAPPGAPRALLTEVKSLLTPTEEGESFQRQYHAALQDVPDVVLAHGEVVKLLRD